MFFQNRSRFLSNHFIWLSQVQFSEKVFKDCVIDILMGPPKTA